jgi:signal transduction histidine kinase
LELRRWWALPLQLFVVIILPLTALLLVMAFGSVALHQRAMRTLVGERDERAARAAATAITEQLNHRATAARSIAAQISNGISPSHALGDATMLQSDFDIGLAVYSGDGVRLAHTGPDQFWQNQNIIDHLADARESPVGTAFLSGMVDPRFGSPSLIVSGIANNGTVALGAFRPANVLQRALADVFSAGDQAVAFVVDGEGQLLYQMGTLAWTQAELAQHPGVTGAQRGDSGTNYLSVGDSEHVVAFSPIPPLNWALVIEEPWQAVADPLLRTTEFAPLMLAPVLVVALISLWFGARQIVQPLQSLEQKATKLAWGDYEAIKESVGGIDEIRRLQTELIHMAQKVKTAQQSLRGYLGAVTTGQEEERRRLARELHDDTIQSLIALNQRGHLARMVIDEQPALDQLAEMQQMTTQIIANLRRLTRNLRPIYLEDLGLVPALDMLARDTSDSLEIPVDFKTFGNERRPQPAVALSLYRIAQEALSNVSRHAKATRASVTLSFTPGEISLAISDNGCGFNLPESPAEMAPAGHFGLLGVHERSDLLGAHLTIESAPGEGTRLVVNLPLQDDTA